MESEHKTIIVSTVQTRMSHPSVFVFVFLMLQYIATQGKTITTALL